jgi:Ca-activated chloride channel family protein
MAAATDTGILRIDAAIQVLNQVIAQIPEAEGVNVGFRIYGHRGNNQPEGQAESCVSSDLLVPMQGVDKAGLTAQVNALQPVG